MLQSCFPHLPDQVYDVQAEVKPIHKPSLIWAAVAPMFVGSVIVFGFCIEYYKDVTVTVTSIEAGLDAGANCSMLGVQSDTSVGVFKANVAGKGGINVWVRACVVCAPQ